MRKLILLIILFTMTSWGMAAQITFNIPNDKLPRVVSAMKGLYPIPIYPEGHPDEGKPQFTDGQWAKEVVRRWIVSQVHRYEVREAIEQAKENVGVDDSIAD